MSFQGYFKKCFYAFRMRVILVISAFEVLGLTSNKLFHLDTTEKHQTLLNTLLDKQHVFRLNLKVGMCF